MTLWQNLKRLNEWDEGNEVVTPLYVAATIVTAFIVVAATVFFFVAFGNG